MTDIGHLLYLVLAIPTITAAGMVLRYWWRPSYAAIRRKHMTPAALLTFGISLHMLGSVIDHSWWSFGWSHAYVNAGWDESVQSWGAWPNIIFRECLLIAAVYFHMRAAEQELGVRTHFARTMFAATVAGCVFTTVLHLVKIG